MIIKKGFIFQGTRSFLKLVYSLDTSSYPIIIIIIIIIITIIINNNGIIIMATSREVVL